MVERRRFGDLIPHLILLIGVAVVAFPVYLCFVGSTHEQSVIANGQMPITPGGLFLSTYYKTIFVGTSGTTRDDMQTIVIGIKKMIVTADALTEWNVVMATAMLAMLPPVAVVVLMQRWFVKGLVETEK